MYAKPILLPLDAAVAHALCCHVTIGSKSFDTPVCGTPVCDVFENCSVTIPVPPTEGILG
jgi:hypothetical protein